MQSSLRLIGAVLLCCAICVISPQLYAQCDCTPDNATELFHVLTTPSCLSSCNNTVEIPHGVEITITSLLDINSAHNGLDLIINGTLKWGGTAGAGQKVISVFNASQIDIYNTDGTG